MALEGQNLDNGRYHLLKLISHSNTSEVYLAADRQLSRQVAIKVILPETSAYSGIDATKWGSRLFLHEAEIVKKLNHPNILALLGYGEESVNWIMLTYLVMPFYPEGSLATWLKQRNSLLSPQEVVQLTHQAAYALLFAHHNQILHLNVKPSNFLIHNNKGNLDLPNLLLTNFCIVKPNIASLSTNYAPYGTPMYMAPEQWNGQPVPATDQYALAIMTYQLLTGTPPFYGTSEQLKQQHLNEQPQAPSTRNPRLVKDIDEVILLALAKKPEDRFKSTSVFARALEQVIRIPNQPGGVDVPRKQRGEDVYTTIKVSPAEALTGTFQTLSLSGSRAVTVPIPAHASNGQVITLTGQGEPSPVGGPPGNLIVTVTVTDKRPFLPGLNTEPIERFVVALKSKVTKFASALNTEPIERFVVALKSKVSRVTRNSFNQANILLYSVLTGIIGCIAGIMLNAAGILPSLVANIATGLGALMVLVATSWAVIERLFPKEVWRSARKLPVVLFSLSTVIVLALPFALISLNNHNQANTDPYTHRGTLKLNDPLSHNSLGWGWDEHHDSSGSCEFREDGTYHVKVITFPGNTSCIALNTQFSNFVYEVQMKIIQGDCGGIFFRYNISNANQYIFVICRSHGGEFFLFSKNGSQKNALAAAPSSAVNTALNALNRIAVVADSNKFTLYVNDQLIVYNALDSSFSNGQIGVIVAPLSSEPTEVAFSNAKVWTL